MPIAENGEYERPAAPWAGRRYFFLTPLGLAIAIVFAVTGALQIIWPSSAHAIFGPPETAVEILAAVALAGAPYVMCAIGLVMIGLRIGYRIGVRENRRP